MPADHNSKTNERKKKNRKNSRIDLSNIPVKDIQIRIGGHVNNILENEYISGRIESQLMY